ncbi:MAG: TadE/TadG family type IV pilus assembly protein [Acidimicrobiales bacterium]
MIEFAIVAPLLGLLLAGTVEFGMAWRDNLTVSSGSRAAARVVSNLGDDPQADYEALLTLEAGLSALDYATIEGVLIYDASATSGNPPAACFDGNGDPQSSASANCNYYSGTMIDGVIAKAANFSSGTSCGLWDQYFCPVTERSTSQTTLTDVGIWVRVDRGWFTKVFPGSGLTIEDQTVMRVEPTS